MITMTPHKLFDTVTKAAKEVTSADEIRPAFQEGGDITLSLTSRCPEARSWLTYGEEPYGPDLTVTYSIPIEGAETTIQTADGPYACHTWADGKISDSKYHYENGGAMLSGIGAESCPGASHGFAHSLGGCFMLVKKPCGEVHKEAFLDAGVSTSGADDATNDLRVSARMLEELDRIFTENGYITVRESDAVIKSALA